MRQKLVAWAGVWSGGGGTFRRGRRGRWTTRDCLENIHSRRVQMFSIVSFLLSFPEWIVT